MLEVRDISKSYGKLAALGPLSLAFPQGETTIFLGPSGCGKSTFLRILIGLIAPDTGEVLFGDETLGPENIRSIRQKMGYVIQDGGLFPHLTARANAALMARHLGWSESRLEGRLAELVALTKFPAGGLDRYPVQLSGGQRQRVSLMRALMLDPDVLLLDEPLAALDPMIRAELQDDLRQIFQRLGKTVVMVTHDIGEAAFFGHRIALMRAGGIVQQGAMADLLRRPADPFVTRFINAQRTSLDTGGKEGTRP